MAAARGAANTPGCGKAERHKRSHDEGWEIFQPPELRDSSVGVRDARRSDSRSPFSALGDRILSLPRTTISQRVHSRHGGHPRPTQPCIGCVALGELGYSRHRWGREGVVKSGRRKNLSRDVLYESIRDACEHPCSSGVDHPRGPRRARDNHRSDIGHHGGIPAGRPTRARATSVGTISGVFSRSRGADGTVAEGRMQYLSISAVRWRPVAASAPA